MRAVLLDGFMSCLIGNLIAGAYARFPLQATSLKPLYSKHFRQFSGSPPLTGWLIKRLERRLQTILFS
jgi:hypothetical protein